MSMTNDKTSKSGEGICKGSKPKPPPPPDNGRKRKPRKGYFAPDVPTRPPTPPPFPPTSGPLPELFVACQDKPSTSSSNSKRSVDTNNNSAPIGCTKINFLKLLEPKKCKVNPGYNPSCCPFAAPGCKNGLKYPICSWFASPKYYHHVCSRSTRPQCCKTKCWYYDNKQVCGTEQGAPTPATSEDGQNGQETNQTVSRRLSSNTLHGMKSVDDLRSWSICCEDQRRYFLEQMMKRKDAAPAGEEGQLELSARDADTPTDASAMEIRYENLLRVKDEEIERLKNRIRELEGRPGRPSPSSMRRTSGEAIESSATSGRVSRKSSVEAGEQSSGASISNEDGLPLAKSKSGGILSKAKSTTSAKGVTIEESPPTKDGQSNGSDSSIFDKSSEMSLPSQKSAESAAGISSTDTSSGKVSNAASPTTSGKVSKEASPTTSGKVSKEASPTTSGKVSKEASPTTSGKVSKEASPTTSGKVSKEASPTTSGKVSEAPSDTSSGKVSKEVSPTTSGKVSKEASPTTSGKVSKAPSDTSSGKVSKTASPTTSGKVSKEASPTTSGKVSKAPSDTSSGKVSKTQSGTSSGKVSTKSSVDSGMEPSNESIHNEGDLPLDKSKSSGILAQEKSTTSANGETTEESAPIQDSATPSGESSKISVESQKSIKSGKSNAPSGGASATSATPMAAEESDSIAERTSSGNVTTPPSSRKVSQKSVDSGVELSNASISNEEALPLDQPKSGGTLSKDMSEVSANGETMNESQPADNVEHIGSETSIFGNASEVSVVSRRSTESAENITKSGGASPTLDSTSAAPLPTEESELVAQTSKAPSATTSEEMSKAQSSTSSGKVSRKSSDDGGEESSSETVDNEEALPLEGSKSVGFLGKEKSTTSADGAMEESTEDVQPSGSAGSIFGKSSETSIPSSQKSTEGITEASAPVSGPASATASRRASETQPIKSSGSVKSGSRGASGTASETIVEEDEDQVEAEVDRKPEDQESQGELDTQITPLTELTEEEKTDLLEGILPLQSNESLCMELMFMEAPSEVTTKGFEESAPSSLASGQAPSSASGPTARQLPTSTYQRSRSMSLAEIGGYEERRPKPFVCSCDEKKPTIKWPPRAQARSPRAPSPYGLPPIEELNVTIADLGLNPIDLANPYDTKVVVQNNKIKKIKGLQVVEELDPESLVAEFELLKEKVIAQRLRISELEGTYYGHGPRNVERNEVAVLRHQVATLEAALMDRESYSAQWYTALEAATKERNAYHEETMRNQVMLREYEAAVVQLQQRIQALENSVPMQMPQAPPSPQQPQHDYSNYYPGGGGGEERGDYPSHMVCLR